MEAAPGFEPGMKDLQSSALPLGYAAVPAIVRERPRGVNTARRGSRDADVSVLGVPGEE